MMVMFRVRAIRNAKKAAFGERPFPKTLTRLSRLSMQLPTKRMHIQSRQAKQASNFAMPYFFHDMRKISRILAEAQKHGWVPSEKGLPRARELACSGRLPAMLHEGSWWYNISDIDIIAETLNMVRTDSKAVKHG